MSIFIITETGTEQLHRVPEQKLHDFLRNQNMPIVDGHNRLYIFKKSIEEALKIQGLFLEFGVMSGETINQISSLIPEKIVYGFDSFKGLPEDWSEIYKKGVFAHDIPKVNSNVRLIVGHFQETLEPFLECHKEKMAFVHMDCDIYSSTKYVLETLQKYDRLQIGTVVQFDDIFYVEREYWYQDQFKAWNELKEKYNIKTDCLAYPISPQCSYIITDLKEEIKRGDKLKVYKQT